MSAIKQLGYSKEEARAFVEQALQRLPRSASLQDLLKAALRIANQAMKRTGVRAHPNQYRSLRSTVRDMAAPAALSIQTIAVAPNELATGRLNAERLRLDHLAELADMHRDEQIMATLGGPRSIAETERFVETNLEHWRRNGFGLWIFRRSSDGAFVGRAGLRRVHVGDADEVEIAYVVG